MKTLPNQPFLTEDFSSEGGGVDFLGMRLVNLNIVANELVPELNNRTADMGTFFLGGWIPWKFRKLCEQKDYTEKNYRAFREKVEVAFSHALNLREEENNPTAGKTRNRVGVTQKLNLPAVLSFKNASRKPHNSLYAAPNYGPSLAYLGFIKTYRSPVVKGKPLEIAIAGDDKETGEIMERVDHALIKSNAYGLLASLDAPKFVEKDIKDLSDAGIDPARFRLAANARVKECFRRKLLPNGSNDPGYPRTLTTRLLLATLAQQKPITSQEARDAWYSGTLPDKSRLILKNPEIAEQVKRWSCFIARQYQRYILELFLWCFETAVKNGARTIDGILDYWESSTTGGEKLFKRTFYEIMRDTAASLLKDDDVKTSQAWNSKVHVEHPDFEWVDEPQDDQAINHGLKMLAGWNWRMIAWQSDKICLELFNLGGSDRIGIAWLLKWLSERRKRTIRELLKDVFSDLIFAQHMRVALARFDGNAQRIRFLMSDNGIEGTTCSYRKDFGQLEIRIMPDRLDTLIALLCDCDVLADNGGELRPGLAAQEVK